MKSVYVVFSYYSSPIAITYPRAVSSFATAKEAKKFCEEKNKSDTRNTYSYARVPFQS